VPRLSFVSLLSLLLATALCACWAPQSKPYAPRNPDERAIFEKVRRDVFPDDVRAAPSEHRSDIVLWTGIIQEVHPADVSGEPGVEVLIEHHYWDFVEDYSVQSAIAFLSPRGEGKFRASFRGASPGGKFAAGNMALVYGTPQRLAEDGKTVILRGAGMTALPPPLYATDVWDYGRAYATKGDQSDLRVLRVPMR
jgi:hypothetical protein